MNCPHSWWSSAPSVTLSQKARKRPDRCRVRNEGSDAVVMKFEIIRITSRLRNGSESLSKGEGWVRGEDENLCTPHPPLRGTFSLRERDLSLKQFAYFAWTPRRFSLSRTISVMSTTGRISNGPAFTPGCFDMISIACFLSRASRIRIPPICSFVSA